MSEGRRLPVKLILTYRSPPLGDGSPDQQNENCPNSCPDESSPFIGAIPAECLAQIGGKESTNDAEESREDEATWLVLVARHEELCQHSRDEPVMIAQRKLILNLLAYINARGALPTISGGFMAALQQRQNS